jgi:hypothetical protein
VCWVCLLFCRVLGFFVVVSCAGFLCCCIMCRVSLLLCRLLGIFAACRLMSYCVRYCLAVEISRFLISICLTRASSFIFIHFLICGSVSSLIMWHKYRCSLQKTRHIFVVPSTKTPTQYISDLLYHKTNTTTTSVPLIISSIS